MDKTVGIVAGLLTLVLATGGVMAQQMQGMQPPMQMQGQERQPDTAKPISMMGVSKVPNPDLLITTLEKQRVLPDEALPFKPAGMGEKFFAKLIAKVDFGHNVWFSIRKARIPKGGNVGIMRTTEICYIEKGLGLLIDAQGKVAKAVPAGSWFTVPTHWAHTLKSIGNQDLIMTVIRVGPKAIH